MRFAIGSVGLAILAMTSGLWLGGADVRGRALDEASTMARALSLALDAAGSNTRHAVERALAKDPVAVIGVAFGLALAVAGVLVIAARGLWRLAFHPGMPVHRLASPTDDGQGPATQPRRPGPTWLEIAEPEARRIPLAGEIHHIGQDRDSVLRIDAPGVAATHALIRRTPEHEFHLIDVSGAAHPAIEVNGAQLRRARLRDGDRIEVGGVAAIFRHGTPMHAPDTGRTARAAPESRLTP